jgi:5-formyltetrahydrofolate cyclo-ligase
MNTDENKENLRRECHKKLNGLQKDVKESSSLVIWEKLYSIPQFSDANTVSIYVSKDNEVETSGIFESLWADGKKVVLAPRIHGDILEMCEVRSIKNFVDGPYGLKEPSGFALPYGGDIDVVVVPGLAFDERGTRLGRGKGYYDRFLKSNKTYAIGLAYEVQIHKNLPKDAHDMSMDMVITEKRIISPENK